MLMLKGQKQDFPRLKSATFPQKSRNPKVQQYTVTNVLGLMTVQKNANAASQIGIWISHSVYHKNSPNKNDHLIRQSLFAFYTKFVDTFLKIQLLF